MKCSARAFDTGGAGCATLEKIKLITAMSAILYTIPTRHQNKCQMDLTGNETLVRKLFTFGLAVQLNQFSQRDSPPPPPCCRRLFLSSQELSLEKEVNDTPRDPKILDPLLLINSYSKKEI